MFKFDINTRKHEHSIGQVIELCGDSDISDLLDGTLVFFFEQWTNLNEDGETILVDVGASSAWYNNTVTDDFYARKKDGGK